MDSYVLLRNCEASFGSLFSGCLGLRGVNDCSGVLVVSWGCFGVIEVCLGFIFLLLRLFMGGLTKRLRRGSFRKVGYLGSPRVAWASFGVSSAGVLGIVLRSPNVSCSVWCRVGWGCLGSSRAVIVNNYLTQFVFLRSIYRNKIKQIQKQQQRQ